MIITPADVHALTCSKCRFPVNLTRSDAPSAYVWPLPTARDHEARHPGHRVTVWDGPTSQIPRSFWTKETQ